VLIVFPPSHRARNVASADSGIDKQTAIVARKLPKKQQHHHRGQNQTDSAFVQQRFDRSLDEQRLIEHYVRLHFRRNIDNLLELVPDAVDDSDRVRIATLLQYRKVNRPLSVNPHDVVLQGFGILRDADVADRDHRAAVSFDRDIV